MNKSEKLLAARRRLKEFQLSKKSNVTGNTSRDVNENANESGPSLTNSAHNLNIEVHERTESSAENNQELISDGQSSEANKPIIESSDSTELNMKCDSSSIETKVSNLSNADRYFQDTVDLSENKTFDEFSTVVSNFTNDEQNVLKKNQSSEDFINVENSFSNTKTSEKSNGAYQTEPETLIKDEKTIRENLQTDVQRDQDVLSNDYNSLLGSQALQKEYLLQMTSAVTNILTNDLENKNITQDIASELEQRNQFLASSLQEQKEMVNRLHVEVSQYKTRIFELETVIATRDADFEAKLHSELNPLKEQLQLHAQTTGILVGEKAELTAALSQSQTMAKQKVAEVEELNGKLKLLQGQLYELERELNSVKNNSEDAGKVNHQLQSNYNHLQSQYSQVKQERDDFELEAAELKQKLNVKNTELTNIQQELKEKTALLSLNELRMQQMTSLSQETQGIGEQHHVVAALEQQLSQLMETLKAVSSERDEASSHYQNYVQQLNSQVTTLALKLEQTTKENTEMHSREHSLIQRLSDLECQIQSHKDIPEPPRPIINENKDQIDELMKNIDQLTMERDNIRSSLYEQESIIRNLKQEIEELEGIRSSNAEASRLASALEGERLAAARAVSQNQQLKQQLSEMQDAFVQLSNDKLDLTEKLQGERAIGKKLNARLNNTEDDVEKLKEEMQRKDLLLAELEKEKLHSAQIADQMQHYQAQSHNASTLQQELHNAQERIETLTKQNQQLINELNAEKISYKTTDGNQTLSELDGKHNSVAEINIEEDKVEISVAATQTESYGDGIETADFITEQDNSAITPEAVKKLEERFKDTMERVAELSDEKQRLEHLVLQLQSETETIGEYVTLYQKQRGVLQERAREKEEAFRQLSEQRNQQQEQLHKLKMLVAELIKDKTTSTAEPTLESNKNEGGEEAVNHLESEIPERVETVIAKDKTTSQILDLLTEIKECKDTCALEPNFHPCPWCSGKLITV